jgi:hypothetical protein
MPIGIAADHGGFELKENLILQQPDYHPAAALTASIKPIMRV